MEYANINRKLNYEALKVILSDIDSSKVTNEPPLQPRNGSVYIFHKNRKTSRDYVDRIYWRNYGSHAYPRNCPKFRKIEYKRKSKSETMKYLDFSKCVYELFDETIDHILVHYLGCDDFEEAGVPHGNRKKDLNISHVRSAPSLMNEIKEQSYEKPLNLYKKLIDKKAGNVLHEQVLTVKNFNQVKNKIYKEKTKCSLSGTNLSRLFEVVTSVGDFVHTLTVFPKVSIVVGLVELLSTANEILKLKHPVLLSYESSFKVGDFYVTCLVMKHPFFEEEPGFPLGFLIHDTKEYDMHIYFFQLMKKYCNNLDKGIYVTNREKGIRKALTTIFPDASLLLCWNEILQDLDFWLIKESDRIDDKKEYKTFIISLLNSTSLAEFQIKVDNFMKNTNKVGLFANYFYKNLYEDLKMYTCRFVCDDLNIPKRESGVTINILESFNSLIKHFLTWEECTLDSLVLGFYFQCNFDLKQIQRGLCSLGALKLKQEHQKEKKEFGTITFPEDALTLEEICKVLQDQNIQHRPRSKEEQIPKSRIGIARWLILHDRVSLDAKSGLFIVRGLNKANFMCELNPKPKCSCNSKVTCIHLIAVLISLKFPIDNKACNIALPYCGLDKDQVRMRRKELERRESSILRVEDTK